MAHNIHHEHLIKEVAELFAPVLNKSPQAIYIYLDDEHKICNTKFAKMLGYKSVQEWVDNPYPISDVLENEQEKGIEAYMNASRKLTASHLSATWVTKKGLPRGKAGKRVKTDLMMVPFAYKKEIFVLHFISDKN